MSNTVSALEALNRLREGNHRFVDDLRDDGLINASRRRELVSGQAPFAILLGCADSRVPAELVFDQGLGDLFVIRVAGNIVAPTLVGSIEYAASALGTRLVVVMGHSSCGAVAATLGELENPSEGISPNLGAIVESIRPAVAPLRDTAAADDPDRLLHEAVRANVRASAAQLRQGSSEVLEQLIAEDGLMVVGAEYDLGTGAVDFFDGVPE